MTYDPYRNQPPPDRYRDEDRAAAGAAILLGALLLAAIGGFIYFNSGLSDRGVAIHDIRPPITQPATTGSAPARETTESSSNLTLVPEQGAKPID